MEVQEIQSGNSQDLFKNFPMKPTNVAVSAKPPVKTAEKAQSIPVKKELSADTFESSKDEKSKTPNILAGLGGLAAGAIAVAFLARKSKGRLNQEISQLKKDVLKLRTDNNILEQESESLGSKYQLSLKVSDLQVKNEDLTKKVATLSNQSQSEKDSLKQLQDIVNSLPEGAVQKSAQDFQAEMEKTRQRMLQPLTYDACNPPVEKTDKLSLGNFFDYVSSQTKSMIRMDLPDFIPIKRSEIIEKGHVEFEIPTVHPENIVANINPKASVIECDEAILGRFVDTDVKMNYGSNIQWTERKVARDLMQNFYDGHGHTLEGVKVKVDFNPQTQTYKVKVSGKGEYNHRDIETFGGGTKSEDPRNAGGFGEGTKIMTIKMLSDFNVPEVKFASTGWEVVYKPDEAQKFMQRQVSKADNISGNYVEFETKNEALVDSILESTNYFYHPQNPDFKGLDFENEHFGFRFLGSNPAKNKGNVYLTQRFEYGDEAAKWDNNAENMTIIFKRKPTDKNVLIANRDRMNLTHSEIKSLATHFAKTMKNEELANAIMSLRGIWATDPFFAARVRAEETASKAFLDGLIEIASSKSVKIKFAPTDKFIAEPTYPSLSKEVVQDLREKGYILCHSTLENIGMKSAIDLLKELRNHGALVPTEAEVKKINILNEATRLIVESMNSMGTQKVIPIEDVAKPTYIFERAKNDSTLAEAITKRSYGLSQKYQGHWIARDYLNDDNFSRVLATRFHEICHQYGSDGQSSFGYKLTDLIGDFVSVMQDPVLKGKLSILQKLWNE